MPDQVVEYSGRAAPEPIVELVTVVEGATRPEFNGYNHRLLEHEFSQDLTRWIARRVEFRYPDGTLDRVIRIDRVHARTSAEFESAFEVPAVAGEDVVRGKVTFGRVLDHRSGKATITTNDSVETVPLVQSAGTASVWQRWLGWVTTGLISAGLIVLWLRKRAHA